MCYKAHEWNVRRQRLTRTVNEMLRFEQEILSGSDRPGSFCGAPGVTKKKTPSEKYYGKILESAKSIVTGKPNVLEAFVFQVDKMKLKKTRINFSLFVCDFVR